MKRQRNSFGNVKLPPKSGTDAWKRSEPGLVHQLALEYLRDLDWSDGWEMRNNKVTIYIRRQRDRDNMIRNYPNDNPAKLQKSLELFDLRTDRQLQAIDLATRWHVQRIHGQSG